MNKARKDANSTRLPYEVIESFNRDISDYISEIETILSSSDSATTASIDAMLDLLSKARALLASSSSFLPRYDVDHTQSKLDDSEKKIQEKRNLGAKKKFSFKTAKKVVKESPATLPSSSLGSLGQEEKVVEHTKEEIAGSAEQVEEETLDPKRSIQGLSGEKLVVDSSRLNVGGIEGDPGDFSLSRLTGCEVRLTGISTALRLSHLSDCDIICAPVQGSIFVQNCSNITLYAASRQIRIHDTKESTFCIYTQSRPTIEACTQLKFGPYLLEHPNMQAWLAECQFSLERNEWENVQDFNWLRANSPNWSRIPESERVVLTL